MILDFRFQISDFHALVAATELPAASLRTDYRKQKNPAAKIAGRGRASA
jgi:hypothetical protein